MTVLAQMCEPYLPFDAASSVWSDVQRTYQSESSSSPMCPILYAPEYSSAMDIYRTLVSSNATPELLTSLELSPRALALTQHLIQLNPSHYSIWHYRANILLHAPAFEHNRDDVLAAELTFLESLAHANMKSYQVWQHRRIIVSALGDPRRELAFIAENLDRDAKNYHTWSYRQWILSHFGGLTPRDSGTAQKAGKGAGQFPHLWDGEIPYTDQLLTQDIRNNSAWNHRWFCNFARHHIPPSADHESADEELQKRVKFELAYTKQQLAIAPNNSSAWNYLRGLHTALPPPYTMPFAQTLPFVKTLISTNAEATRNPSIDQLGRSPPQALEWWLDTLQQQAASPHTPLSNNEKAQLLTTADIIVQRLLIADNVRKRFYSYRLKQVKAAISATPQ